MNSLNMVEPVGDVDMDESAGSDDLPACCGMLKCDAPFVICSKCTIPIKVGKEYFKLEADEEECFSSENFEYILCRFCIKGAEEEGKKNPDGKFTVREEKIIVGGVKGKSAKIPELKATLQDFTKQKLDKTVLAPTARCKICRMEHHNICSGYMPVPPAPELFREDFICKSCRRADDRLQNQMSVNDILKCSMLESTPLSEYMEINTNQILIDKLEALGKSSYYKPVHVRVVSSMPKTYKLPTVLANFLKQYDIGSRIHYRNRMILCFQEVETPENGDMAFFAIYTQEYGADAPLPNRNTVYLSIIDSVKFFEPFELRRYAYFPILSSYVSFSSTWGTEKMFLWACPPLNDTEYVFYRRPGNQKNLSGLKLTQWYKIFMNQCKRLGIIHDWQELRHWAQKNNAKEFFQNFPLFHEDFWPGQIVQIIEAVDKDRIKDDTETQESRGPEVKKSRFSIPAEAPKNRETLIFKNVVGLLKQQNNFFFMSINQEFNLEMLKLSNVRVWVDPQIENYLGSSRDVFVKFLQSGNLSFGSITEAVYSTRRILAKIIGEQPRFCEICLDKISKGKLQKGGLLICCECWKNLEGSLNFVDYWSHTLNSRSNWRFPKKYWNEAAEEWCQRNKNVLEAIAKGGEDVTHGTLSVDDMLKDLDFLSRLKGLAVWKHLTADITPDDPTRCVLCFEVYKARQLLLKSNAEASKVNAWVSQIIR